MNANALWLTTFVGAHLLPSGFTGSCPVATILAKLGIPHDGCADAGVPKGRAGPYGGASSAVVRRAAFAVFSCA